MYHVRTDYDISQNTYWVRVYIHVRSFFNNLSAQNEITDCCIYINLSMVTTSYMNTFPIFRCVIDNHHPVYFSITPTVYIRHVSWLAATISEIPEQRKSTKVASEASIHYSQLVHCGACTRTCNLHTLVHACILNILTPHSCAKILQDSINKSQFAQWVPSTVL